MRFEGSVLSASQLGTNAAESGESDGDAQIAGEGTIRRAPTYTLSETRLTSGPIIRTQTRRYVDGRMDGWLVNVFLFFNHIYPDKTH